MEDERALARRLANHVLDRPRGDPDDDLAVLSRQLLRADEALEGVRDSWGKTESQKARLSDEKRKLLEAVNGLIGLCQIVRGRDDCPAEIADILRTHFRIADAEQASAEQEPF